LAIYNSEIKRGIMHTKEYKTKMKLLQKEFDEWNVLEGGCI